MYRRIKTRHHYNGAYAFTAGVSGFTISHILLSTRLNDVGKSACLSVALRGHDVTPSVTRRPE